MSTNEEMVSQETPVGEVTDDLDAFSADFFSRSQASDKEKEATPPQASEEEDQDEAPAADANDEEATHPIGDSDTPADEEEDDNADSDEDEETPPEPVKPKSRSQKRIEELNTKYNETLRELQALKSSLEQKTAPPVETQTEVAKVQAPSPDDVNEDGTEKYPLGEFDPTYIRDLTRHTLNEEREAMKAQEKAEASQKVINDQKAALQTEWEGKLAPARERYPDFQEKGEALISQFDGIDQNYGEYLTATIMSMDYGTDVLYHLANHPDEARAIVAAGPQKATIALGRLEAKFADAEAEKQLARPKITKAPTPPAHVNKGSAVARAAVAPDTDDLDAFSSEFFKKGRK